MRAVLAIAVQTVRSAFRSKVFFIILLLIFAATFMLPNSVIGDATLAGAFKIKINYSIGIITFLAGMAALWVGTVNISSEIEGCQIHMVVTKPVGGFKLWLGKFTGISVLCGGILLISSCYIYYVISSEIESIRRETLHRSAELLAEAKETLTEKQQQEMAGMLVSLTRYIDLYASDGEAEELKKLEYVESPDKITLKARMEPLIDRIIEFDELKNEILTGRKFFYWAKPNYRQMAQENLKSQGRLNDLTDELTAARMLAEESRTLESKAGSLPLPSRGQPIPKIFMFEDLPDMSNVKNLYVRFRVFAGDSLDSKPRNTAIGVAFTDEEGKLLTNPATFFIRTSRFYTERLSPAAVKDYLDKGHKKIGLAVFNLDHIGRRTKAKEPKELVIQAHDGPHLLAGETSFAVNYWRCIMLITLFVAFLVIVGTAAGLCFSTPVAVMMSVSYVIVSVGISSVLDTNAQFEVIRYEGQMEEQSANSGFVKKFHKFLKTVMISVETFSHMEFVSSGKTISWEIILKTLLYDFVLKGLPLMRAGLYALQRRELGLVIRK